MSRRIRSNAGPIVLSGSINERHIPGGPLTRNTIIDHARDQYTGDLTEWALELLWCTQVLRLAYDSARIGGGIDPELATNVPSLESARAEGGMVAYLIGSEDSPYDEREREEEYDPEDVGGLNGYTPEQIQDMIVHAEAVATLILAVYN